VVFIQDVMLEVTVRVLEPWSFRAPLSQCRMSHAGLGLPHWNSFSILACGVSVARTPRPFSSSPRLMYLVTPY
jgi:hypothetical protein